MIKPWMVIGGVTFLIALGSSALRPRDIGWFRRLRRPGWLVFEPLIPLIWTIIFIGGAWSAYIVWRQDPGSSRTWLLMGFYGLLEIVIVAFSPVTLWTRNLRLGAAVGGTGFILGFILAILVWPVSAVAAALLIPYLLWSPIGTYTTWVLADLNRDRTRNRDRDTVHRS